ncbi:MAG: 3-methyl-2-oxobutanoate hydroxymethyltransferase [Flavobacteriales bacterium]|nr:MAG: 3-methyl-2-oxobutanoate hydroxymethyltransferase [Flavobacteriales bacterium]
MFVINLFALLLSKKLMISQSKHDRVTIKLLEQMKSDGEKISMLTAYDYSFAKIIDNAGIDIILVGDSASNVMAGHETTLPITLDQMIYHASSVVRAVKRALVIVDLPFGTYQADPKVALKSAIRIMKESGAHAVKLEGGKLAKDSIERILKAGIPVMGHLGLTPQSIYKFGTYNVRAKEEKEAKTLINDALLLEEIGCFSLVLEKIPNMLSKKVLNKLKIPIIGIGAGSGLDGQVLVSHDMLGMNKDFSPRFLRRYLDLDSLINKAVKKYSKDIKNGDFPNKKEQY